MPLVTERHQKRQVRYAEGEHEPRWLMSRNMAAYRVVVRITDQWWRNLGACGRAHVTSRYLDSEESERCLNGLPTGPAGWLCLRRKKRACSTTTTSGPSTFCSA